MNWRRLHAVGDDCESLQALDADWLKGRTKPRCASFCCLACWRWLAAVPCLGVEVQAVKAPVPVECREPIPGRPAMPTEALADDANPLELLRAALAEIDRREEYEVRLLAALTASV